MKTLPTEFERNGWIFSQMARSSNVAILAKFREIENQPTKKESSVKISFEAYIDKLATIKQ